MASESHMSGGAAMTKTAEKREMSHAETGRELQHAPPHPASMFEEMDRVFDTLLHRGWLRPFRWDRPSLLEEWTPALDPRIPRVDVIERDDEIVVRAELPGIEKKDLDVSMTDDSVTIKGALRREEKEEKGEYYRCEISRGAFARTVGLPSGVDAGRAKAKFEHGVLQLVLPKTEKTQRRHVEIE
jgi:HSP20 family protein